MQAITQMEDIVKLFDKIEFIYLFKQVLVISFYYHLNFIHHPYLLL